MRKDATLVSSVLQCCIFRQISRERDCCYTQHLHRCGAAVSTRSQADIFLFVSLWTLCWRLQFVSRRGCQSRLTGDTHTHRRDHSQLHKSASQSGSCYVHYVRRPHRPAEQSCRVLTWHQWDLVWMSHWNTWVAEWCRVKLEVSVLVYSTSALGSWPIKMPGWI